MVFPGVSHLRRGKYKDAIDCGYRAARCFGKRLWDTTWQGVPPCGGESMPLLWNSSTWKRTGRRDHRRKTWLLTQYAKGDRDNMWSSVEAAAKEHPSDFLIHVLLSLAR